MLCHDCDKIIIKHSRKYVKLHIRRYNSFSQLKSSSSKGCDFCTLIFNDIGNLETQSFEYCRRLWGEELYRKGLEVTSIDVFYVNQPSCDIIWTFCFEVLGLYGYKNGPTGGYGSGYLGGVFVDTCTSTPFDC